MKSPTTGKEMKLIKEKRSLEFRKESFEVVYHYFKCNDTEEEFVNEELENLNLGQVYNAYRAKYRLPFPEEIKDVRNQYDLPATVMSEILGFGVNQYRLYENGDIPSETNGRLIQMAANPDEFIRLLELSDSIHGKQYEKLLKRIIDLRENAAQWETIKKRMLGIYLPGVYNGYRKANIERAYHMIRFFVDGQSTLKTALNKLLFYSDFYHFKQFGYGISGLQYRAIQWGPVPSQFDYLFKMAEESNIINLKYELWENDKEIVIIEPASKSVFRSDLFTEEELQTMKKVSDKLNNLKTGQLVNISHKEPAWKENIEGRKLIDYNYAFGLIAL